MPNDGEHETEERKDRYVVLVCGLNIRDQNRITLEEQRLALGTIANELELVSFVGDKGSYLVESRHSAGDVRDLVLNSLRARCSGLTISGVAIASPRVVRNALAALSTTLVTRYRNDFTQHDHGFKIDADTWRAGLALPLYPAEVPPDRAIFHKIKNAIVFGWAYGCVLVAKREAKNVHWGKIVTGPASSQMRLYDGVLVELTSRSANVLRDLVG